MAICSFRADNFDFPGLLTGEDLGTVLAWLARIQNGFPLSEAEREGGTQLIESFVRSGLASVREGAVFLDPSGEKLLQACRAGGAADVTSRKA